MEHRLDRNRKLADYIYNDLDPEEIVEFEREISNDPQLSESYRLNMQVKDYLQAKVQLEEMRSDPQLESAERLANMAFEFEPHDKEGPISIPIDTKRNRFRNMSFVAAIAATVTIIIAVGIIPSDINQDRLFDRYYHPYEASDYTQRSSSNGTYGDIAEGINTYSEEKYNQSIRLFNGIASDAAIRSEVNFYTGLSYLGLGQYIQAQNVLELIVDGSNRYQAETLWYLSLCYLKDGEFEKATTRLEQLETYAGMYKEDAQTLLKKLRRFK